MANKPAIHEMTHDDVVRMATCLHCAFFCVINASPGYSEYTPGSPVSIYCEKQHFDYDEYNAADFFKKLRDLGAKCPDFSAAA